MRSRTWFGLKEPIPRWLYLGIAGVIGMGLPLAVWAFITYGGHINPLFLPTPTQIVMAIREWFAGGTLVRDVAASAFVVFVGFGFSAVLAIPVGVVMGTLRSVEAALEPSTAFIRYLPTTALIPLSILILGVGSTSKIAIVFVGTYFQLVLLVAAVAENVPKEMLESAYTLGVGRTRVFFRVLVPASLPGIMDNLRITLGWAWTYLVSAELIASDRGIGFQILQALRGLRVDRLYAGVLIIGALGLTCDAAFRELHKRLLPWSERAQV